MWQLENQTPFEAAGDWVRDRDGAETWLVALRCAFRILPNGGSQVDTEQQPPVMAPVYRGEPGRSSLIYDSDFVLTKPTTDIVLNGHAYAPGGQPVTRVDVGLRVGATKKTLRVIGDRHYLDGLTGLTIGQPRPFVRMPIVYERAWGGSEQLPDLDMQRPKFARQNPVGCGFAPRAGDLVPNIEAVGTSHQDIVPGFGPIAPHWHPRAGYAGTYDARWERDRMPLYPQDLDDRFFLSAPADQRPDHFLSGGEPVSLVNLSSAGRLDFVLPKIALRFETEIRGKPSVVHRAALHTVILEPDALRVLMVWRTALRAHADVNKLEQTVITQLHVLNPPPRSIPLDARGNAVEGGE